MKKGLLILVLLLSACTNETSTKTVLSTEENKAIYTLGQMYARQIEYLHLSEKDTGVLIRGFQDWTLKKKSEVDYATYRTQVQKLIEDKLRDEAKLEKEKGQKYFENFIQSGGLKTESGLGYRIIQAGSAVKPKEKDSVEVHYHGTFINGEVFDSSIDRKEKATFPLRAILKGWSEGLQMIGEGGEIELVIPSDLGYGDEGSPPVIPGGATLIFRIQLFKVIDGSKT